MSFYVACYKLLAIAILIMNVSAISFIDRYAFVDTYTVYWANQITSCISESLQSMLVVLCCYTLFIVLLLLLSLANIQASSSGTINGDDFTISLNANVAGVFECSLDGGSFQSCKCINIVVLILLSTTSQAHRGMYFLICPLVRTQ